MGACQTKSMCNTDVQNHVHKVKNMSVVCTINGHAVLGALDTSNHGTMMSEQCAKGLNIFHLADKNFSEFNGEVIGKIHLYYVYMNDIKIQTSIVIVKQMQRDFVLGLNVLDGYNCTIDLNEDNLFISGSKIKILHSNFGLEDKSNKVSGSKDKKTDSSDTQEKVSNMYENTAVIKKPLGDNYLYFSAN